MELLAIVSVIVAVGTYAVPMWLTWETNLIRGAGLQHGAFFHAASRLMADERTDPRIVDLLKWMGNRIDDDDLAHELFRRTLSRYRSEGSQIPRIDDVVRTMPPDLHHVFNDAQRAFFYALSFRSKFFGALWRRSHSISGHISVLAAGQVSMEASTRPTGPNRGLRLIRRAA